MARSGSDGYLNHEKMRKKGGKTRKEAKAEAEALDSRPPRLAGSSGMTNYCKLALMCILS